MTEARDTMRSPAPPGRPAGATATVIVVGLDGSPASWDAFSWAAVEAVRAGGSLIAVYVTPMVECVAAVSGYFDYVAAEQARQEVAAELAGEAAQRAGELGVPVSFVREPGDAVHVLTSVARSAGADLVVVGKSAKMRHHVAGSLGRRLVCRHDAPVVVVVP